MRDKNSAPSGGDENSSRASEFRWQAFFQRAREPLFLLNRRRQILFVNRAWEELTGVGAATARGVACTRRKKVESDPAWSHALSPPREVLEGRPAATRKVISEPGGSRRHWDIEFFPLQADDGLLLIVGKIKPLPESGPAVVSPIPDKLIERRRQVGEHFRFEQLEGESPALRRVLEQVRLAGQTQVSVLIVGEPGSGKHLVARIIHHQGTLSEKYFAALDCAGLPEPALKAALFGENGLLNRPDLGTLYLAEPSCLPRDLQARIVETLSLDPPEKHARPRLIAGTCHSPEDIAKAGQPAENILSALGTLVIHLPVLRSRSTELPDLAHRILEHLEVDLSSSTPSPAGKEAGGLGLSPKLTPAAIEVLQAYSWPGNWRELGQVLASAVARRQGDQIDAADLPSHVRLAVRMDPTPAENSERQLPLDSLLEQAERRLILHALKLAGGNKTRAAEILSIWRPRLLRRMEALGIEDREE
jgi:PAS domain S-box-containing protein